MKSILRTVRNYFCYCGIEKDEYNALKKDAYISNFRVWRLLHILMTVAFAVLSFCSVFSKIMEPNKPFYLLALVYSIFAVCYFLAAKMDSLVAQFVIYLSISVLFLFGCFISQNSPDVPATTFVVFLLITPMFMIDKPYFMTIELCAASAVFLIWMSFVKPYEIWIIDLAHVIIFTITGVFLHIIANSIRIREFVLTRKINIQKDTDELTGLKNKGALTREINAFFADESTNKGMMFLLDVDKFKSINDTYGHDTGDDVIRQLGSYIGGKFTGDEVSGRFGGDEFIIFIKNVDDPHVAYQIADDLIKGVSQNVTLPDPERRISISIGVSVYAGAAKNYSELLKKADIALYRSKADPINRFCIYE